MPFPAILLNCLWHSTTPDRYESIIKTGAILPEPDIPDGSRWHTGAGAEHYPYVRTLGGVSLFDFVGFDPKQYGKKYVATWASFVPLDELSGNKVWIEINRDKAKKSLIEGKELVARWKAEKAHGHCLMPLIEVAHIGPIALSTFDKVLHFRGGEWHPIK